MYKFIIQENEKISDIIFHSDLGVMIKDIHEYLSEYELIGNEISSDHKAQKNYITLMSWKSNGKIKGKYVLCIHKDDLEIHKENLEKIKIYATKMLLFDKKDLDKNEKEIEAMISLIEYDNFEHMAKIFHRSKLYYE